MFTDEKLRKARPWASRPVTFFTAERQNLWTSVYDNRHQMTSAAQVDSSPPPGTKESFLASKRDDDEGEGSWAHE